MRQFKLQFPLDYTITCRFRYSVLRRSNANEDPALISDESTYELSGTDPIRQTLFEMINGDLEEFHSVIIPSMMPRFLAVRNRGAVTVVNQLQRTPGCEIKNDFKHNFFLIFIFMNFSSKCVSAPSFF